MDARFTAEQDEIRSALRDLLRRRCGPAESRSAAGTPAGYDPELWTALARQLGLPGLALPEKYGGVGCSVTELALACEETGRVLAATPLLSTAVLVAPLILALGTETQRADLLPRLASGSLTAALAAPPGTALALTADNTGDWAGGGRAGGVQARPAPAAVGTTTVTGPPRPTTTGTAREGRVAAPTGPPTPPQTTTPPPGAPAEQRPPEPPAAAVPQGPGPVPAEGPTAPAGPPIPTSGRPTPTPGRSSPTPAEQPRATAGTTLPAEQRPTEPPAAAVPGGPGPVPAEGPTAPAGPPIPSPGRPIPTAERPLSTPRLPIPTPGPAHTPAEHPSPTPPHRTAAPAEPRSGTAVRRTAPTPPPRGSGWRLYGQVDQVLDGHSADLLLVAAHAGGFARSRTLLFLVPGDAPGLVRTRQTALDATRPQARIQLRDVEAELLGADDGADVLGALARTGDTAAAVLACEAVGAADRALEMTVEYVGQREQFGRAIGSFQAVKHRLADVYVQLQAARSAAYFAAWAAVHEGQRAGGLALAQALEALRTAAAEGIQLHGGIGFTWEHEAQRYFKRATADELLFGPPHRLRARAADAAGLFARAEVTV